MKTSRSRSFESRCATGSAIGTDRPFPDFGVPTPSMMSTLPMTRMTEFGKSTSLIRSASTSPSRRPVNAAVR